MGKYNFETDTKYGGGGGGYNYFKPLPPPPLKEITALIDADGKFTVDSDGYEGYFTYDKTTHEGGVIFESTTGKDEDNTWVAIGPGRIEMAFLDIPKPDGPIILNVLAYGNKAYVFNLGAVERDRTEEIKSWAAAFNQTLKLYYETLKVEVE